MCPRFVPGSPWRLPAAASWSALSVAHAQPENIIYSRGPQRPRAGAMGNSKHPRTNLGHIWENIFLKKKNRSEKNSSLSLNGLILEPKVDFGAKSRPQHGSTRKISGLRTKIKITRAVELRSSKFWKFWKAESTLLLLGTTFMGRNPLYPAEARASKKHTRSSHRISREV